MFCSVCGNAIHEGDMYCERCGNPLTISQNKKRSSTPVIFMGILGIVVLICVIIGGIFFFVNKRESILVEKNQINEQKEMTQSEKRIVDEEEAFEMFESSSYVENYSVNNELGNDVKNPVFMLDGVIYRLPCRLDDFLNNEWRVAEKYYDSLEANSNADNAIVICKDGIEILLSMANFSKSTVDIEACAAYGIYMNIDFSKVQNDYLLLPNSVNISTDADDLKNIFTDWEIEESSEYIWLQYSDLYKYFSYDISKINMVRTIQIVHSKWDY